MSDLEILQAIANNISKSIYENVSISNFNLEKTIRLNKITTISTMKYNKNTIDYTLTEDNYINYISFEGIEIYPNTFIHLLVKLKHLKALNMSYTKINDIIILKELKNIEVLDISSNNIKNIEALKELKNLKTVYAMDNKIRYISKELIKFFNFNISFDWNNFENKKLLVGGNSIQSPPIEIIKNGQEAIKNYYEALQGETKPLNEVKLLLVGDGGAGKTSLVKRLIDDDFDEREPQTDGINIDIWQVGLNDKEINARVWDFGGQEIMHATHQFFLTKRSLYLLVLDGRKEENPEYWLKHIKTFGGDSKVLIVLNKYDEHPSFEVNRVVLKEKYPNIVDFFKVSCKSSYGIEELLTILKKELSTVEMIGTKFPKNWFNIKTYLENYTKDYISLEEYHSICKDNSVESESKQKTLIDFLNDLGIVLHFNDFNLLDTQVLNPKWITRAVYKIINSNILAQKNGILRLNLLDEILKPASDKDFTYPKDKHSFIVNIMEKFELCYFLDREKILIPDLLEVNEPSFEFEYEKSLKIIFVYDFLPRSIITRFIVKTHTNIKDRLRWRTGVVLQSSEFNSTAVIKADIEDKKIFIFVDGEQKRDYFAYIKETLLSINNSFEKLECDKRIVVEGSVTVSYNYLLNLEAMGKETFIPERIKKEYSVKEFLGMVDFKRKESTIEKIDKFVDFDNINIYGVKFNTKNFIKAIFKFFKK